MQYTALPYNAEQLLFFSELKKFITDTSENVMLLKGRGGRGKTACMREVPGIIDEINRAFTLLDEKHEPMQVVFCGTTGSAADSLRDEMKEHADLVFGTLHSYLKLRPSKTGKDLHFSSEPSMSKEKLPVLIVVDEASYVDSKLKHQIAKKLSDTYCKFLCVGDKNQLAGGREEVPELYLPKYVYKYEVELVQNVRQNPGPLSDYIDLLSISVETNSGPMPKIPQGTDEIFELNQSEFLEAIKDLPRLEGARCIAYTNRHIGDINGHILESMALDPNKLHENICYLSNDRSLPYSGDFESVIRNNEKLHVDLTHSYPPAIQGYSSIKFKEHPQSVFIYPDSEADHAAKLEGYAQEKNWKKYYNLQEKVVNIKPIFCSTVHKVQGKTLDAVYIDLDNIDDKCRQTSTIRRLVYVAFSRAKRVYVYGKITKLQ